MNTPRFFISRALLQALEERGIDLVGIRAEAYIALFLASHRRVVASNTTVSCFMYKDLRERLLALLVPTISVDPTTEPATLAAKPGSYLSVVLFSAQAAIVCDCCRMMAWHTLCWQISTSNRPDHPKCCLAFQ